MATPQPPPPKAPNTGDSFKRQKLQNRLAASDQKRRQQLEMRGSVVSTSPAKLPGSKPPVSANNRQATTLGNKVSIAKFTDDDNIKVQIVSSVPERNFISITLDKEEDIQIKRFNTSSRRDIKTESVAATVIAVSPQCEDEREKDPNVPKMDSDSPIETASVHPLKDTAMTEESSSTLSDPEKSQIEAESQISTEPQTTPVLSPMFDPESEDIKEDSSESVLGSHTLTEFALIPCPTGKKYQCKIHRGKNTVETQLFPQYELYMEDPRGPIFLMSARKRKKSASSNYCIETVKISSKKKEEIIGKVRGNFLGTSFVIYNGGYNPFKTSRHSSSLPAKEAREELGAVTYDPNILGFKGPRKMAVMVPRMLKNGHPIKIQPEKEAETILEKQKKGNNSDILVLHNKAPQWNEESQSYVLNFSGRVTMASVKNFQIVHDNDPDYIIMQFGRVNDETFTLDFQYPLSPLQAFGIALTSFDAKLACE